ncbi:MAG: hypothetical protein ACREAA_02575 [Candidatus Polarisedimenticolia bacterium]
MMNAAGPSPRASSLLFASAATGIYATALAVSAQLGHLESGAGAVAAALTVDLALVVPAAFYLCVVRRHRLPLVTVAPVFVLAAVVASWVLPADRQQALRILELLAVPLELGLIGWIGWRAVRAIRKARHGSAADPLEMLRRAAVELTRNERAAAILTTEIGVLLYGLGLWLARPHAPAGAMAFSHHRRSAHAAIMLAFILILAVEGFGAHMLLRLWSGAAAWLFTLGTAYGALWLIADYRAVVLRPILVDDEGILIRAGFRCTLWIPRERLAGVVQRRPDFGKESLCLTFLGTPTHWLVLSEPMRAEGAYGFRRSARAIGIVPDDPAAFERQVALTCRP